MTQKIIIVNACGLLSDEEVHRVIPALQLQYDRDFKPAWGELVPAVEYQFAPVADIPHLDPDAWPIFLNKHSQEAGDLGWHTDERRKIYGRVFVGDCMRFGISWTTDLGHEALEMAGDPSATKAFRMSNGDLVALENCDPVEADKFAYIVEVNGDKVLCTDFAYPSYFSNHPAQGVTQFDQCGVLRGPCPTLSDGGYISIQRPGEQWTMLQQNHIDGLPGRRFLQSYRHRRVRRTLNMLAGNTAVV